VDEMGSPYFPNANPRVIFALLFFQPLILKGSCSYRSWRSKDLKVLPTK
jgi:hypothetical protein